MHTYIERERNGEKNQCSIYISINYFKQLSPFAFSLKGHRIGTSSKELPAMTKSKGHIPINWKQQEFMGFCTIGQPFEIYQRFNTTKSKNTTNYEKIIE